MIKSRTQSERSVVVVDVVLVVVVAVAVADEGARQRAGRVGWAVRPEVPAGDGDHSGHGHDHGHVYDHDLLRLSRD